MSKLAKSNSGIYLITQPVTKLAFLLGIVRDDCNLAIEKVSIHSAEINRMKNPVSNTLKNLSLDPKTW